MHFGSDSQKYAMKWCGPRKENGAMVGGSTNECEQIDMQMWVADPDPKNVIIK